MTIGELFELAREVVREAEREYLATGTREAQLLLGAANIFATEVARYRESLADQGAQVSDRPPPRGQS